MDDIKQLALELANAAPQLLAAGYIEAPTAHALAGYGLEAQFATADADEPGGACSWSPTQTVTFFDKLKAELTALGLP